MYTVDTEIKCQISMGFIVRRAACASPHGVRLHREQAATWHPATPANRNPTGARANRSSREKRSAEVCPGLMDGGGCSCSRHAVTVLLI
ncbi:hypothetical protein PDJAM_G00029060 [Pangasius djambal]|uniref:Uncharacterized protein n=1 Tax=Pangasius djambal TaxID=1691987 RepID=A0ACC5YQR1_9TELE|nr:hypothetical protein [Pangasius djambal]